MPQGKKKKEAMLKADRKRRVAIAWIKRDRTRRQSMEKMNGKKKKGHVR